jgi:hypothetical protein
MNDMNIRCVYDMFMYKNVKNESGEYCKYIGQSLSTSDMIYEGYELTGVDPESRIPSADQRAVVPELREF